MKILLANKFYYLRGGDCIYMLNLEQMLKKHGHDVAIFAMDYPQNFDTEWKKYFPSNMSKLMAFTRPFGSSEVQKKFESLLDDFKPDVVHLNNIHTQLSPVIAKLAHERNINVVWTIHDLKLLCPRYDCLRNGKTLCDECFTDKKAVLKYSCMKNSKLASIIAYQEALKWNRETLESFTDTFICPSQFMADKMKQGGFDVKKIKVLCNFIDIDKCKKDNYNNKEDYYSYIGRISHEKGIKTLIEAANQLPYKLKIVGSGPLEENMKIIANSNIEFVGFKEWKEIKDIIGKSKFNVLPSIVYENNPLSIIESLCLGTPVLGAYIGGIPELINDGITGMTFKSSNVNDMKDKIDKMFHTSFDYKNIALKSQEKYNSEKYYNELIKIYTGNYGK